MLTLSNTYADLRAIRGVFEYCLNRIHHQHYQRFQALARVHERALGLCTQNTLGQMALSCCVHTLSTRVHNSRKQPKKTPFSALCTRTLETCTRIQTQTAVLKEKCFFPLVSRFDRSYSLGVAKTLRKTTTKAKTMKSDTDAITSEPATFFERRARKAYLASASQAGVAPISWPAQQDLALALTTVRKARPARAACDGRKARAARTGVTVADFLKACDNADAAGFTIPEHLRNERASYLR